LTYPVKNYKPYKNAISRIKKRNIINKRDIQLDIITKIKKLLKDIPKIA